MQTGPDQLVEQSEAVGLPMQNDAFDKRANGTRQRNGTCCAPSLIRREERRLVLIPKQFVGWDIGNEQPPYRLPKAVEIGAGSERNRLQRQQTSASCWGGSTSRLRKSA